MDNGASSYRRFLQGDDQGIVEIIRDYKDGLMFFLNRYVNDLPLAEELTEDTFFRLVTRRPRFRGESFKTWLYTVGRNIALNELKRRRRISGRPPEETEGLWPGEKDAEQVFLRQEQKLQLHRALQRLSADYAAVLHLKFFEELPNEQIARVLKKTRRQVENLTYQAKLALKRELEQEGFDYEDLS